jgi:murein DD-endopeptidase MepM/ murein hydrolase activator NlpD
MAIAGLAVAGFSFLAVSRSGPAPAVEPVATASPSVATASPPLGASPTATLTPQPTRLPPQAVAVEITYTFPIVDCASSYSHYHHDYPANDIYVAVGCPFVAVTAGVVDEVGLVNLWPKTKTGATRGGKFVSIVGDDGVRYYGSHLSEVEPGIRPGVRVDIGTLLGKTGLTGNSHSPHLHFGMSWPTGPDQWWVRRGEVYPWKYLDAWRQGISLSPVAAVAAQHKIVGDGGCTNYC